jgi:DNA-binding NarL/FixJ family response regulator
MIRVLLADDHGVIRDGLGRLIAALDGVALVGVARDGAEAVEQAALLAPDVVLMDLDMPVIDGIEATKQISKAQPGTAVLVLTAFADRPRIIGALDAGACGYLLKDVDAQAVGEAIRAAARGESPCSTRAPHRIRQARCRPGSTRCSSWWSRACPTS